MEFVSMDLAMQYMMNYRSVFDKVKDSFLESYQNYEKDYQNFLEEKDYQKLDYYIQSIKGISLNLGAKLLYDASLLAIVSIENKAYDEKSLNIFFDVLGKTYKELKSL
ncbi:MAG: hypothetical protein K2O05_02775 [Anaeroplasmataceae bacterium]|nr:hypothetical protein [Anaeroplasmataceae bacterium]